MQQKPKIRIIQDNSISPISSPVKISKEIQIDQSKQPYFSNLLSETQINIQTNGNNYNLYAFMVNDIAVEQFWNFEFEGSKNFKGKKISGVLKFQPDHPLKPPKFYFNPVISQGQVYSVIQHENIYGDHSLCIPMLNDEVWNQNINPIEILQAIEHIFANPNWVEGSDAPANPIFSVQTTEEKQKIQLEQSQYLPNFEQNQ